MRNSPASDRLFIKQVLWKVTPFFCFVILVVFGCLATLKDEPAPDKTDEVLEPIYNREYDLAESMLKDRLRKDPTDSEKWVQLGEIYLTIENFQKARYAFQESLSQDPEFHEAQSGLWAVRLMERGYPKEARKAVGEDIKAFESSGAVSISRLRAVYQGWNYLHDYDSARAVAEKIMLLGADKETIDEISLEIAERILAEKSLEKRQKLIDWYLNHFPSGMGRNLVYQLALKIAAKDLEDQDKLEEYGERWVLEEPKSRIARAAVANRYVAQGMDPRKSIKYLRKALRLIRHPDPREKPDQYPDQFWKEDLQIERGQYYDNLGWANFQLGKYKKAEEAFSNASHLLEFDHRLEMHRGMLFERRGDRKGALQAYLKSALAGNRFPEAQQGLKRLFDHQVKRHLLLGQLEKANLYREPPHKFFARREGITFFTDVTNRAGLKGIKARRVAWGDYNGDGFEDLLLDGKILMRNQGNETFYDVTREAGIPESIVPRGGVWADFNNDGFLDFHASGGSSGDLFLKNNGDGTFRDITEKAIPEQDGYPTEAAAWGDFDRDGFVDLYVANYELPLHKAITLAVGTPDRLWHNNGNGTFSDVARESGTVSREKMAGRGVSWGDYNNDGAPDIFVSNYRLDPNFLWQNRKDGTFSNVAAHVGVKGNQVEGYFGHTIGSVWGDYDNDGDLDLFSANLAHPRYIGYSDKSMLLENLGPPDYLFTNRFRASGIRYEETHSDPSFIDYDNDGFLDLYITSIYPNRNSYLYRGDGRGQFEDVTYLASARVSNGWGNAFADMDNDGDLDLMVGSQDGVRLFQNNGNSNSWLQVKVIGTASNRSGIGSRVSVVAGPYRQIREVEGGKGVGNQHSMITAFGFGNYRGTASVQVRFPSRKLVALENVALDQRIEVEETGEWRSLSSARKTDAE